MYWGRGYTCPGSEVALMFYKTVWSITSKIQTVKMALETTASDLFLAVVGLKKKMRESLGLIFVFHRRQAVSLSLT